MANFNEANGDGAMTRAEHVLAGYPESNVQTWVLGTDEITKVTAVVYEYGGVFEAAPDYICAEAPWASPEGA
jgi:hypothetical protein